jgi:hypothetical protein
MSTGVIIGIVIIVVLAIAAVTAMEMRRAKLRRQFGPELERLTTELGSRRKAEAELMARRRQAAKLDIQPLSEQRQALYTADWTKVQEQFVDSPVNAVASARRLISRVMRERGYPDGSQEETRMNLSVHQPRALEDYQEAEAISERSGQASTEDLRSALVRYRVLFDDLIGASRRASTRQAPRGRVLAKTAASNNQQES